jgi:hypothetical protein
LRATMPLVSAQRSSRRTASSQGLYMACNTQPPAWPQTFLDRLAADDLSAARRSWLPLRSAVIFRLVHTRVLFRRYAVYGALSWRARRNVRHVSIRIAILHAITRAPNLREAHQHAKRCRCISPAAPSAWSAPEPRSDLAYKRYPIGWAQEPIGSRLTEEPIKLMRRQPDPNLWHSPCEPPAIPPSHHRSKKRGSSMSAHAALGTPVGMQFQFCGGGFAHSATGADRGRGRGRRAVSSSQCRSGSCRIRAVKSLAAAA